MKILILVVCMITTSISAQTNMFSKTLPEFAAKALVDSASIDKALQYLQLETVEMERKETTFRLKDEIKELEDTLRSLQSTINTHWKSSAAMAEFNNKMERRQLVSKVLALRFQVALERYMIHYLHIKAEKNETPNQPASQSSEVVR